MLPDQELELALFFSNEIYVQSGKRMIALLHPETFMVFEVDLLPFIVLEEFTFDFLQRWFPSIFILNSKLTSIYMGTSTLKSIGQ